MNSLFRLGFIGFLWYLFQVYLILDTYIDKTISHVDARDPKYIILAHFCRLAREFDNSLFQRKIV
jgi:hypothetical protein